MRIVFRVFFAAGFLFACFGTQLLPAEAFTTGSVLYTTQRDVRLRSSTTLGGSVVATITKPTRVIWLSYAENDPDWSYVRFENNGEKWEGYTATSNLASYNVLEKAVPAYTAGTSSPVSGLVIATAATRAFSEISTGTQEYAKRTNREEALRWLFLLAKVEQSVDLDAINQHQRSHGLFTFPIGTPIGAALGTIPVVTDNKLANANATEDEPESAIASKCKNFSMYPVTEQEIRQISEIALVATANRFGGFFDLRTTENFDLHKTLYGITKALALHSMRPGPYRISVLNSRQINAFSTPGGDLMVTRGLLELVSKSGNENWLALVLGHEIKHVVTMDGLIPWRNTKMELCTQILDPKAPAELQVLRPAMEAAVETSCKGSLNLDHITPLLRKRMVERYSERLACESYPEDAELLADTEGQRLSILSGYRPIHRDLFLKLEEQSGFGNHPKNTLRIENINKWLQDIKPGVRSYGFKDWPFTQYALVPFDVPTTVLQTTGLLPMSPEEPICKWANNDIAIH